MGTENARGALRCSRLLERQAGANGREALYNQRMNRRSAIAALSATIVKGFAMQDRIVIVGAGIMGASIAYHLSKRGARVTVLEKQRPGAGAT